MARVLVIEDQPADRDLMIELLSYYGYAVLEARDGAPRLVREFAAGHSCCSRRSLGAYPS